MTLQADTITEAFDELRAEMFRANEMYGDFASAHEGYAVLKKEVDELWDVIKENQSSPTLRHEAVQVGAMALKFIMWLDSDGDWVTKPKPDLHGRPVSTISGA